MKLFVSPTSPYARKCRALIIEKSLEHKIEVIECDPRSDPAELLDANPLGKVPALTREGAPALMDSPLICEFIDSLDDEKEAHEALQRRAEAREHAKQDHGPGAQPA